MYSQSAYRRHYFGAVNVKREIVAQNMRIENVLPPELPNDAATKQYVDDHISSSNIDVGIGLEKIGSTFNVKSTLTHVNQIGNINTGTWSADTINIPYGGTGKSSFTNNKLIIGNGTSPLISVNQLTFSNNLFTMDTTVRILNTTSSVGIGTGGSLTVLGGASISGKVFIGQDLNVSGNITVGNITINGSSSFNGVVATNSNSQNGTISNLWTSNITSSNLTTTNLNSINLTSVSATISNAILSQLNASNISSSNLRVSNNTYLNTVYSVNMSSTNVSTNNFTTNNLFYLNATGSSLLITNSTINNLIGNDLKIVSITSTTINNSQTLTSGSIFVKDNSILNIVTAGSILSPSNTLSNVFNTNITSTNMILSNSTISNVISSNINVSNLMSNNLVSSNITNSNLINTNLTNSNLVSTNASLSSINSNSITSGQLKVTGISILGSVNSNNLTTGNIYSPNLIVTNSTQQNIVSTSITTSNINILNITSSNLNVSNVSVSLNITTSNLIVNNQSILNDVISNNISTSNLSSGQLRISGISILGTVNSNNLSTGTIFVSNSLTVPFLSNTSITSTNTLTNNMKAINISSNTLIITGNSILGSVGSNNLSTGTINVSGLTTLNNIVSINNSTNTLISDFNTSGNIFVKTNLITRQQLLLGSSYSGSSNPTSGSHLTIAPSIYTDNVSLQNSTISIWTPFYISTPTLAAQNSNITTQRASSIYVQSNPIAGANQTITNSAALSIGYVGNSTGGNLNGQILLERSDGSWFGSIYTEQSSNRIVIANGSLAGGGGIGLYSGVGTPIVFSNIPSANNVTPVQFAKFTNITSTFYSTQDSNSLTTGSVVISGGLGVSKNITCDVINPSSINASIRSLNDVNKTVNLTTGHTLVWNGTQWNPTILSGVVGSGPRKVNVYSMNLIMPVMTSNGPIAGSGGNYYVSASSEYNSSYAAYKCLSSVKTPTEWATLGETSNFWIQVQFPTAQNVKYAYLEGRANSEDPTQIKIQGSNDGSNFIDIIDTQTFTGLNYPGYFSTRIPENYNDYLYYRFLFPSGSGLNPGLLMLRLFKYGNSFTESIMDNSSVEGNGNFDNCTNSGRWPMAFNLDNSGTITIRAQISCFAVSNVFKKFVMYIDGAPFSNFASSFVKQFIHPNIHTNIKLFEWTGQISSGIHTLSFFTENGGTLFDTGDTVSVNIIQY